MKKILEKRKKASTYALMSNNIILVRLIKTLTRKEHSGLSRQQKRAQQKAERRETIRFWLEIITFIVLLIDHLIAWL